MLLQKTDHGVLVKNRISNQKQYMAKTKMANCGRFPVQWQAKANEKCPDQWGSVGWASSSKAKGRWFNSQSGRMPGLQASPGWWKCERQLVSVSLTHRCFSPSFYPSIPLSLKINKIFFKRTNEKKTLQRVKLAKHDHTLIKWIWNWSSEHIPLLLS